MDKSQMIARIEFPLLEQKLTEGLRKKKIPFVFETKGSTNVLTIRIVDEYFLDLFVTQENVDKVVALTPYLITRPDKANTEFPYKTRLRIDYRLARIWGK